MQSINKSRKHTDASTEDFPGKELVLQTGDIKRTLISCFLQALLSFYKYDLVLELKVSKAKSVHPTPLFGATFSVIPAQESMALSLAGERALRALLQYSSLLSLHAGTVSFPLQSPGSFSQPPMK